MCKVVESKEYNNIVNISDIFTIISTITLSISLSIIFTIILSIYLIYLSSTDVISS